MQEKFEKVEVDENVAASKQNHGNETSLLYLSGVYV
jgi:hypothetical protein